MANYSPMMEHYLKIKQQNPDALIFYRLGDFYEMFFEDAKVASQVLDLILTGRNAGVEDRVPMCGVPAHALSGYLNKLVQSGFKVAIVEQMEEAAAAKGMVKREVTRIVSPGTNLDENSDSTICAVYVVDECYYLALYSMAVGIIYLHRLKQKLYLLEQFIKEQNINEIITCDGLVLAEGSKVVVSRFQLPESITPYTASIEPNYQFDITIGLLVEYLKFTQKQAQLNQLKIEYITESETMRLDYNTKQNLELTGSKYQSQRPTLYQYLNKCSTAMGNRTLRQWIEQPLYKSPSILERQQQVCYLLDNFLVRHEIIQHLGEIYDLQRLIAKINYGMVQVKDLLALQQSLVHAHQLIDLVPVDIFNFMPQERLGENIVAILANTINDDPLLLQKDHGTFKTGYNLQLDHYRDLLTNGEQWIFAMEQQLREETGIKNLKIGYNKVFGYYIEISKGNLNLVKPEYGFIRKQTLVNGERYITEQLKSREDEILQAYEMARRLEQQLWEALISELKQIIDEVLELAIAIGKLDAIVSLAVISDQPGFCFPIFNNQGIIRVKDGKHPILANNRNLHYVPNDWDMDEKTTTLLITGPNMGGKSTYIRQIAIMVIMAQMGCKVMASSAELPIFDQIFTRIGASDDIAAGQSTFMVEMLEANYALSQATVNSLILFDELGRGTSTYDGMALAQAMIEYITTCIKAKTLFSTHYHELVDLEQSLATLTNINMKVKETSSEVIFLYQVAPGKADKSYGINVAKLAHLPTVVIDRAAKLLKDYEQQHRYRHQELIVEMVREPLAYQQIKRQMTDIDLNALTPIQALNILNEWKSLMENTDE